MTRLHRFFAIGAALTLAAAACSDSTGPDPFTDTPQVNLDIAKVAADGVADDVELMRGLGIGLHFGMGLFPFMPAPGDRPHHECPYDANTGYHVCAEIVLPGGITINRSYGFFDASGAPMEMFDGIQTASINMLHSSEGDLERTADDGTRWSASIDRSRDMTVWGLQGDEQKRTWDGTGSSDVSRARFPGGATDPDRAYDLSETVLIDGVELPTFNNDQMDPWPLAGTITKQFSGSMTLTRDGETVTRTIQRTVVIEFDGTQYATATVTGPNGTETFQIDLALRHARRMHKGPGH